jgi:Sec-independent protein translocase protein TatA
MLGAPLESIEPTMPSFELTSGEIAVIVAAVALVVLPSRLSSIGNFVGRLLRGPKG